MGRIRPTRVPHLPPPSGAAHLVRGRVRVRVRVEGLGVRV